MDLFDIAPEGWWDDMERLDADVTATDVTEDAPDSSLLLASQQYEAAAAAISTEEEDQLLLLASQQYKNEDFATIEPPETSTSARFKAPVTDESIDQLITSNVPRSWNRRLFYEPLLAHYSSNSFI